MPLTPGGAMGGSTWEPECETSFRGKDSKTRLKEALVERLYGKLSERMGQTPEAFHFEDFQIRNGKLYYRDNKMTPLMNKWNELRSVGVIAEILGKEGLHNIGFNIPVEGRVTAHQAVMLNRVEEELPFPSDVAKADNIELQEIMENADNLIVQLKGESSKDLPKRELLGPDKQCRSIRGSLKVETAKKVELQQCTEREKRKLMAIQDNPEHDSGIQ